MGARRPIEFERILFVDPGPRRTGLDAAHMPQGGLIEAGGRLRAHQ